MKFENRVLKLPEGNFETAVQIFEEDDREIFSKIYSNWRTLSEILMPIKSRAVNLPERFHRWQKIHPNISFIYSFKDIKGRNPNYFKDVDGPTYAYLPGGKKMQKGELKVESVPVLRGSGFLVEVDGLVIFHGGDHILLSESQEESFKKTIDYLKETGKNIDLLIMAGNFTYGKVWPVNLKGVDYAAKILKPKVFLVMAGDSSEFVLKEVFSTLKKYSSHTKVFCPDHRGDSFLYGIDERKL